MSEKRGPVISATDEFPDTHLDHYSQSILARKTSYFQYPGKVTKAISEKRTGINSHSGARWYRWHTTNIHSVRLNSAGKFITVCKYDKVYQPHLDYWTLQNDEHWIRLFKESFGSDFSYVTVHPLAPHYDLNQPPVATGFSASLKEADLRSQVVKLFGKTRVRRDLMRAVGGSHPNAIMLAREFRGLVPIDWIVDFLMRHPRNPGNPRNHGQVFMGNIRPMLYRIDPRSYRSLLRATMTNDSWYSINDVGNQFSPSRNRRPPFNRPPVEIGGRHTTWESVHNTLFGNYNRMYRERTPIAPQPIPATPLSERLSQIGGVVIPEITTTLQEWGDEMSNCIGSYAYSVTSAKRSRELGGIYDGDKLIANFEIDNGSLRQLLGRFNKPLPVGVRLAIELEFIDAGVSVPPEYWGSRAE